MLGQKVRWGANGFRTTCINVCLCNIGSPQQILEESTLFIQKSALIIMLLLWGFLVDLVLIGCWLIIPVHDLIGHSK